MDEQGHTSEEEGGPPPSRGFGPPEIGVGLLIAFGMILLTGIAVALVDVGLGGDVEEPSTAAKLTSQGFVALTFLLIPIGYGLMRSSSNLRGVLADLGLLRISLVAVGIGVAGWFLYILLAIPLAALLEPEQEDITRELGVEGGPVIGLVVAGILVIAGAAVSEEVFFRGFVYGGLRSAMPIPAAAIISGILFGSLHLVSGDWAVAIQLSLLGVLLALIYERTGSLWTPIVAHAINNTIAYIVLVGDFV